VKARLLLAIPFLSLHTVDIRAEDQAQNSGPLPPLAYVRRLVLTPVQSLLPAETSLPPRPITTDKNKLQRWENLSKLKAETALLRARMPGVVLTTMALRLAAIPGITLLAPPSTELNQVWPDHPASIKPTTTEDDEELRISPDLDKLKKLCQADGADGGLAIAIDRFGIQTGLERGIWVRAAAYLAKPDGKGLLGPFYGVGWARAGRRLLKSGFSRTDDQLIEAAVGQATAQITHSLITGEASPLAGGRVAILPALLPQEVEKTVETYTSGVAGRSGGQSINTEPIKVRLPSLLRQDDVLFQPELGPISDTVDAEDCRNALEELGITLKDLWTDKGVPNMDRLDAVSGKLKSDYLFVSRITDIDLSDSPYEVMDVFKPVPGLERRVTVRATGALYRKSDTRLLWTDKAEGGTISHTEYVRHHPRLRTDEQCVLDAARTAYAHLRYSFDEYRRRFER
jgi:hypothetical protein